MIYESMTSDELKARHDNLLTEGKALLTRAEGPLTGADASRFEELEAELEKVNDHMTARAYTDRNENLRAETREATRRFVDQFGTDPSSIPPGAISHPDGDFNVIKRKDPFDLGHVRGLAPEQRQVELRGRAMDAIERFTGRFDHMSDYDREHIAALLENRDEDDAVSHDTAEYIVQTGSPEYTKAFTSFIRNPQSTTARMKLEELGAELEARTQIRAAQTISGVSGSVMAPYWLDPALLITNSGVVDPIRQVARQVTITGTDKWVPPFTAGISAGYIAENGAFSDNTPTFTSTSIQTYKAGAYAMASFEAAADSNMAAELGALFADAKDRFEGQEFALGTGSSAMQGVVVFASNATSVVTGSSGAANAADLVAADIYALRAAVPARYRPKAVWMGSTAISHKIRQLGTTDPNFTLDLKGGDFPNLIGRPFYENSNMDSTIVSGSTDFALIHGDFSQFVVVNRLGMAVEYVPVVQSGGVPYATRGWIAHWRTGSGGLVQSAFAMLKL